MSCPVSPRRGPQLVDGGFHTTTSGRPLLGGRLPFRHFESRQCGDKQLGAGGVEIDGRAVVVASNDCATPVLGVANVLPRFQIHMFSLRLEPSSTVAAVAIAT